MSEIFGIIMGLAFLAVILSVFGAAVFGVFLLFRKAIGGSAGSDGKTSVIAVSLLGDSMFYRILLCGVLILVSLIPLSFVNGLVNERGSLYRSVASRMTEEWSGAQQISGPILTIPYEYTDYVMDRIENKVTGEVKNEKRPITVTRYLTLLPDKLDITSELETQELKRGIYKVPIYTSKNTMAGSFKWPDLTVLDHQPEKFIWNRAVLSFLIVEAKGIQGGTILKWNASETDLSPGLGLVGLGLNPNDSFQGVHARLVLDEGLQTKPVSFEFTLNLRGSSSFSYAPTGKESTVKLHANWGSPSFQGKLLPSAREITEEEFRAEWGVTHLSRSYDQFESLIPDEQPNFLHQLKEFSLGVDLFDSVNLYTLLDRTIKYGVMFISLTFFSIFIVEFASDTRLHWLQHLIIGAALSMFYLCMLAFSEHIAFGYAYVIGTALITGIIGVYAWVAIGRVVYGLTLGGVLIALYSVLYSILQMEDFALLIGTLLLLVFLVLGMYVTRNMGKKSAELNIV